MTLLYPAGYLIGIQVFSNLTSINSKVVINILDNRMSNLIYKKGTITTSGSSASYRLYVDVDPKKLIILATALEDNGTVAVVKETISITFSTTAAAINKSMDVDYILFFK